MEPDPHALPSAARLVPALPVAVLEVVVEGEARPVTALEIVEPDDPTPLEPGDLGLLVGATTPDAALGHLAHAARAGGIVARRTITTDERVRAACRERGLPLLALADDATWSQALGLLRTALDQARTPDGGQDPYADLFTLADRVAAILDTPVTIEDAQSRVLAYSTGQHDVDPARTSTIVGRRVPRAVRDHFRGRGVFRRLATSDEPILVPAGAGGIRPRFVVPVRAGQEWLGSMWAVVDGEVSPDRAEQARVAAQVVALHLLRLRAHHEVHDRLLTARLRATLRGEVDAVPDALGEGPWRVVALAGPVDEVPPEDRLAIWSGTLRRRGWRQPLLADVERGLHAVVAADGEGPGSWAWLARTVATEASRVSGLSAFAGAAVDSPSQLAASCAQSAEVLASGTAGPTTVEHAWADLLVLRGTRVAGGMPLPTPVRHLAAHDAQHHTAYVPTLLAVLDHWGDSARAASALGVHPNTVRNRTAQILRLVDLDPYDPTQRLAAWLDLKQYPSRA